MAAREEIVDKLLVYARSVWVDEVPELALPSAQAELEHRAKMLIEAFEEQREKIRSGDDYAYWGLAFSDWLTDREILQKVSNETRIEVSITRKYGMIDIGFSISRVVSSKDKDECRIVRERLIYEVNQAHADFASKYLPQEKSPNSAQNYDNSTQEGMVEFSPTKISVKVENGKTLFRLHGGAWSRFGVPLYDEILIASGFHPQDIPYTGLPLSGYTAVAQVVKGQPKRITELKSR